MPPFLVLLQGAVSRSFAEKMARTLLRTRRRLGCSTLAWPLKPCLPHNHTILCSVLRRPPCPSHPASPLCAAGVAAASDRAELSRRVVGNPAALAQLEAIVHPLVAAEQRRWLQQQAAAGQDLVVLDIPLLYETGGEARCDAVAVVSAPPEQQRQRALARPGMSDDKLGAILRRQVPDEVRRQRAAFVIDTVSEHSLGARANRARCASLHGCPLACLPR